MSRRTYRHSMDALIGKPIYYGINATTESSQVLNPIKDQGAGGFYIPNTEARSEVSTAETRPTYVAPTPTLTTTPTTGLLSTEETRPMYVAPTLTTTPTPTTTTTTGLLLPEETRPPYVAPTPTTTTTTTPVVPIIPIIVPVPAPTPTSGGGSGGGSRGGGSMPSNSALAPSVAVEKSFLRRNILPIILVAVATYIFIKKPIK